MSPDRARSAAHDHGRPDRRLWLALLGLAAVPAAAAVVVTSVLFAGKADTGPSLGRWVPGANAARALDAVRTDALEGLSSSEAAVGLVVVVAGLATLALLIYLRRPLREVVESRTQLASLYEVAREESRRDPITGLGNQRAFQEDLASELALIERNGRRFVLALMDLDDLKLVNDREGHAAGDETLADMAATMRSVARPHDRLYRIGGDEFAMLFPDTDLEIAEAILDRLLVFACRPPAGVRPSPFSAGLSAAPQFARDPHLLCRQADAALYWVKRHGRAAVDVFDPDRDQLPGSAIEITRLAVQEVLLDGLLAPVFQPIVDLRSGRVLGYEGLIRPDPKGPLPDATRLFEAAALSGRTVELDVACVEQVLGAARAIGSDQLLTLNLSPRTLEVRDFDSDWLLQSLYRHGISPGRVIVELTERDEIDDLVRLRRTFQHLRQYGLRLAVDDLGAGNSGLRLLSQVQFDVVKLDLSLVQDAVRRVGSRAFLQSVRDLALDQQAHVVAEGVETAQQLRVLRELEIEAGQGYLLGRPASSVEGTFVDIDGLGAELAVVAVGSAAALPGQAEGGAATRPAIVLPTPRAIRVVPASFATS